MSNTFFVSFSILSLSALSASASKLNPDGPLSRVFLLNNCPDVRHVRRLARVIFHSSPPGLSPHTWGVTIAMLFGLSFSCYIFSTRVLSIIYLQCLFRGHVPVSSVSFQHKLCKHTAIFLFLSLGFQSSLDTRVTLSMFLTVK